MLSILIENPIAFLLILGLLALAIGSFLNVVIYRLPIMIDNEWREDTLTNAAAKRFSLSSPSSHCPQCKQPLRIWHNIPILSYLLLRGQCRFCGTDISIRYPLVELITLLLSLVIAVKLGPDWKTAAALLLTWMLIALAIIDLETMMLPDELTLTALWAGLLFSLNGWFTTPTLSILGAASGYLLFWGLNQIFFLLTQKQGMGYGDMKLLAALGAWFGLSALPFIILVASVSGLLVAALMLLTKKMERGERISFGPYLCLAGWLFMIADPYWLRISSIAGIDY